MVWFQKVCIPHGRLLEFQGGEGVSKANVVVEKYETKNKNEINGISMDSTK